MWSLSDPRRSLSSSNAIKPAVGRYLTVNLVPLKTRSKVPSESTVWLNNLLDKPPAVLRSPRGGGDLERTKTEEPKKPSY